MTTTRDTAGIIGRSVADIIMFGEEVLRDTCTASSLHDRAGVTRLMAELG